MDYSAKNMAVRLISKRVLTPVIYLSEYDNGAEFICFCDGSITISELYEAEQELSQALGINAEILDIREFNEPERIDIVSNCELIYSEDKFVELLFQYSMLSDFGETVRRKNSLIERKLENGSYYIQ